MAIVHAILGISHLRSYLKKEFYFHVMMFQVSFLLTLKREKKVLIECSLKNLC